MFDTTSNVQTSFLMLFVSCLTLYTTDVKRNSKSVDWLQSTKLFTRIHE